MSRPRKSWDDFDDRESELVEVFIQEPIGWKEYFENNRLDENEIQEELRVIIENYYEEKFREIKINQIINEKI